MTEAAPPQKSDVFELPSKRDKKQRLKLSKLLRLYVLPITALAVFLGILTGLILPRVSAVFAQVDVMGANRDEIAVLDSEISQLQTLLINSNQTSADLDSVNTIAPTGTTEVVRFRDKIIRIARGIGMDVTEATTGEQRLTEVDTGGTLALGMIEIPSNFVIRGTLAEAKSFIQGVKDVDDFVIIGQMELKSADTLTNLTSLSSVRQSNWVLQITLIKYQFQNSGDSTALQQMFLKVPAQSRADQDTLDFIRSRATSGN